MLSLATPVTSVAPASPRDERPSKPFGASRRVACHVATLALVLLVGWMVAGRGAIYHADEGAALAGVDLQRETGSMVAANPSPDVDPEFEAVPLALSERSAGGRWAPFAKHPVYVWLLDASWSVAGRSGPALLSLLGTLVAATGTAALTGRVRRHLALPALWVTGLATPLLFDGYLVIAHSLGAACTAWATWATLGALDPHATRRLARAAIAVVLVALGVFLRTEAVILAGGLAVGVLAHGGRAWPVRGLGVAATVAVVGGATSRAIEPALIGSLLGERASVLTSESEPLGFVAGRLAAFSTTWLHPGAVSTLPLAAGFAGTVLVFVLAIVVRRHPGDRRTLAVLSALAVAAYAIRATETGLVLGLLVAFPLVYGALGLDRRSFNDPTVRLLAGSWIVFALGVLATQYEVGGSGEWGGRYFAIGLPLVVPLALVGWDRLLRGLDRGSVRVVGSALVAIAVLLGGLALTSMRVGRDRAADVLAAVLDARSITTSGATAPLAVLATEGRTTRLSWEHIDEGRWMTIRPATLDRYSARLADLGEPVVFLSGDPKADGPVLVERWDVEWLHSGAAEIALLTPR